VSLLEPVSTSLAALDLGEKDAGAAALAQLYARQIDRAAATAALADRALRDVEKRGDDVLIEMVQALKARLSERDTLDRLGARLTAVLVELHATPRARAAGKVATPAAPTGPSPLQGLRGGRAG
jgi:hypothetical protein